MPEQLRENFGAFVASIDRRIARLQAFAGVPGTTLPVPERDASQIESGSQSLDRLCKPHLSRMTAV